MRDQVIRPERHRPHDLATESSYRLLTDGQVGRREVDQIIVVDHDRRLPVARYRLAETLKQLDSTVGLESVRVIHANDSKTAFASRADRHQHIGKGRIGIEAFRRIVRHAKLQRIPFICETPIDRPGDEKRNLRTMRTLARVQADGKR